MNPKDVIAYLEKTRELLNWVETKDIVDTIFEESNLRQELIIRSRKIIKFLAQEGELKPSHIARILQAIQDNQHDRNRDIKNALYDTLIESTQYISKKSLTDLIWKNLRVMERKTFSPNTILLINTLLRSTKDDNVLTELCQTVWELVFEDPNIPRDTHEKAIEKLVDISKSKNFNFQADCIRQIENNQSSTSFIRLLMELMESQGDSKSYYASQLVKIGLPTKILENYSLYIQSARKAFEEKKKNGLIGTNEDASDVPLVGIYTHLDNVKNRLKFIEKMLSLSKNNFENESLENVWEIILGSNITLKEKDFCLDWMVEVSKNSEQLSFVFKNFFCNPKNSKLFDSESSFNTFLRTFCTINNNKANIRSSISTNPNNFDFKVLDIDMVGYQDLWTVILGIKDEFLFKKGLTFLLDLHLKLDKLYENSANQVRFVFCRTATKRLRQFSTKIQNNEEDALFQCNRLLGILKEFIEITEVKKESTSSHSNPQSENEENKLPAPRFFFFFFFHFFFFFNFYLIFIFFLF